MTGRPTDKPANKPNERPSNESTEKIVVGDPAPKEGVLTLDDPRYPAPLRTIPDPPKRLYYRGDLSLLERPMVAVVGSRKATPYGACVTKRIAGCIASAGAVLVSGLATGIDSIGHRTVLAEGGRTIAVLGNSLDIYYPRSNRDLQDTIAAEGLLLSEYPESTKPARWTFPQRNRIISGLSLATVLTEAGVNSGSLITAECAVNQGRPVYCVPGNISSEYSLGTNLLLCDGAIPLVVADHLLSDLGLAPGPLPETAEKEARVPLSPMEKRILNLIREEGEVSIERLCQRLSMSPAMAAGLVSVLEIKGIVTTALGKVFLTG